MQHHILAPLMLTKAGLGAAPLRMDSASPPLAMEECKLLRQVRRLAVSAMEAGKLQQLRHTAITEHAQQLLCLLPQLQLALKEAGE